jgi:Na+/H+-dicarboxylate symporter
VSPATRSLLALAAGLVVGLAAAASGSPRAAALVSAVEPLGVLWINALRMTVIPLVVSLLVVGVAAVGDARVLGPLGARALLLFLALLAGSALAAALVVPPLFEALRIDAGATAALRAGASAVSAESVRRLPTFGQWVAELAPANPVRAAVDGALLPLAVFSIAFGMAAARIRDDARRLPLLGFFGSVADAMLAIVRWLMVPAPVGVFALAVPLASRVGLAAVGAIGIYLLVICGLFVLTTAALYAIAVLAGRVPLGAFARALLPAQVVALASRSSLASLPALVEGAERELRLAPHATGFLLPLAAALFKISTPATWIAGTLFVARLYDVPLGPLQVATVAVASILTSFGAPGIPSASLVLQAPLHASLGLPVEGIGILIAVDAIPDITKTVLNATAFMTVAVVLGRTPLAAGQGTANTLVAADARG